MYGFILLSIMSGLLVYLELKEPTNKIGIILAIFMLLLSLFGLLLSL